MVHIWIDRKPVLTETLANTPISSYLIREQNFFALLQKMPELWLSNWELKTAFSIHFLAKTKS